MTASTDRSKIAEQTQRRRMAQRVCGNCGAQAEAMQEWGGRSIAICLSCQSRLQEQDPTETRHDLYAWRQLEEQGIWCELSTDHPCNDCMVLQVEARIIEPVVNLAQVVDAVPRDDRRSFFGRAVIVLAGLLRRSPTK